MRLPRPNPIQSRPGEAWLVAPEPYMVTIEDGGLCTDHPRGSSVMCNRPAVAATRKGTLLLCDAHLRESLMWIESGVVVSWRLVAQRTGK